MVLGCDDSVNRLVRGVTPVTGSPGSLTGPATATGEHL
jgi:hypothetical protein